MFCMAAGKFIFETMEILMILSKYINKEYFMLKNYTQNAT